MNTARCSLPTIRLAVTRPCESRTRTKPATLILLVLMLAGCATTTRPGVVSVERKQLLIIPAADVERMADIHYSDQYNKAKAQGRLVTTGYEFDRVVKIGRRLIGQSTVFRGDTKKWKWHFTLIDTPTLNASCAPGGKITVYTGLI